MHRDLYINTPPHSDIQTPLNRYRNLTMAIIGRNMQFHIRINIFSNQLWCSAIFSSLLLVTHTTGMTHLKVGTVPTNGFRSNSKDGAHLENLNVSRYAVMQFKIFKTRNHIMDSFYAIFFFTLYNQWGTVCDIWYIGLHFFYSSFSVFHTVVQ